MAITSILWLLSVILISQGKEIVIYNDCIDFHLNGCSFKNMSYIKARTSLGYYNEKNEPPCERSIDRSNVCRGNGWTKLRTVDSRSVNTLYDSNIWTAKGVKQTAFNPMFWSTNVSEICVQAGGLDFKISVQAPSMRSLFFEKRILNTNPQFWLDAIVIKPLRREFNFVHGCYEAGFNVGNSTSVRARLGIVSLKKPGCPDKDQAIGLGVHVPGTTQESTIYSSRHFISPGDIKIHVRSRPVG